MTGCTFYYCCQVGCVLHPDTYGKTPDTPCPCSCHKTPDKV